MMTQEDIEIEKGKGEETVSGKTSLLIQKLQQENKLNITVTTEPDYIPVRGTWHTQNPTEDFDLDEHVDKFLQGEEKVLLILGDSGAGKSIYCQQLIQRLWKHYDAKEKPLPLFISLPSLKDPLHHAIEETLQSYGLKAEEITALKQSQRFIFILDAYDEIRQDKNLCVTNKLKDWNAKIIITCRNQYLYTMDHYVQYFMPYQGEQRQGWLFSEVVIKPFNQEQIDRYLQQYVQHHKTEWSDWQEYKKYIDEIPGLRKLIETPFLLKLAVEALPSVVALYQPTSSIMPARTPASRAQGSETSKQEKTSTSLSTGSLLPSRDDKTIQLTRAKLYDVFIEQWFERQEKKLKASQQINEEEDIKPEFWGYAKALAKAMYVANVTQIEYQVESDLFSEKSKENPWQKFLNPEDSKTALLQMACLLREVSPHRYAFIHSSFIEYFLTRELYQGLIAASIHLLDESSLQTEAEKIEKEAAFGKQEESDEEITTSIKEKKLTLPDEWLTDYFNKRLLVNEYGTLQFLADRVVEDEEFKQSLFDRVYVSKETDKIQIAAANAITVLNQARIPFSAMDLSGIRIPQADLTYCILDHTNLRKADLTKAKLKSAWLRGTQLQETILRDVDIGERPFLEHQGEVRKVVYSPDGQLLATCTYKTIYLWEVATSELIYTLEKHSEQIQSIAFSPDSKTLASGSDTVRLWNVRSGQLVKTLTGHGRNVNSVAFNPDGKTLASGGDDGIIRLWDTSSKSINQRVLGYYWQRIKYVTFSRDGKFLVWSHDDTVKIWDIALGQLTSVLKIPTSARQSIVFTLNSTILASTPMNRGKHDFDCRIPLWDVSNGQLIKVLEGHADGLHDVAFNPEGTFLASGSSDGTVKLWEIATGKLIHILKGHANSFITFAFSPDGKTLAWTDGKRIKLWEIAFQQSSNTLQKHVDHVMCIAFRPDGHTLVSCSSDDTVRLWSTNGQLIHTTRLQMVPHHLYSTVYEYGSNDYIITKKCSMALSPDRKILASTVRFVSSPGDDQVFVWDVSTGKLLYIFDDSCLKVALKVLFSPDGKILAMLGGLSWRKSSILLWDVRNTPTDKHFLEHWGEICAAVFTPNGQILASATSDGTVRLWDMTNGQLLKALSKCSDRPCSISFSPNGKILALGGKDGTLQLWNTESGQKQFTLTGPNHLTFNYNGKILASASRGGTVSLWEIDSGKAQFMLEHMAKVTSLKFSPNDQMLATAGNSVVRLWDSGSGRCLAILSGYFDEVTDLIWHNNDLLATAGHDGSVKCWRLKWVNDVLSCCLTLNTLVELYALNCQLEGTVGLSPLNAQLLKQYGAKGHPLFDPVDFPNFSNWLPIQLAVANNNIQTVEDLLDQEPTLLQVRNSQGDTLLHIAVRYSNLSMIKLLLDQGADYQASDEHGRLPWKLVKQAEMLDVLPALETEFPHRTFLHVACANNRYGLAEWLLQRNADPNVQDDQGCTSLHLVAKKGYREIVALLLRYQADSNVLNQKGQTPLALVVESVTDITKRAFNNDVDENVLEVIVLLFKANALLKAEKENESCRIMTLALETNHVKLIQVVLKKELSVIEIFEQSSLNNFYHAHLDRTATEALLIKANVGAFLFRRSSVKNSLAISCLAMENNVEAVQHFLLTTSAEGYILKKRTYKTLAECLNENRNIFKQPIPVSNDYDPSHSQLSTKTAEQHTNALESKLQELEKAIHDQISDVQKNELLNKVPQTDEDDAIQSTAWSKAPATSGYSKKFFNSVEETTDVFPEENFLKEATSDIDSSKESEKSWQEDIGGAIIDTSANDSESNSESEENKKSNLHIKKQALNSELQITQTEQNDVQKEEQTGEHKQECNRCCTVI